MRFDGFTILSGLIALWLGAAIWTGCAEEADPTPTTPSAGQPCDLEGATYQQLICRGGLWVNDMPSPDMNACTPESNTSFCMRQSSSCGLTTGKDNCGSIRTISCGDCPQGSCQNNQCSCKPEDDATFCSRQSKTCGSFSAMDNCGQPRTADCGMCEANKGSCQEDNTCAACDAETDAELCMRLGKTCGQIMAPDNCEQPRTASCGMCTAPATCQADNTCN